MQWAIKRGNQQLSYEASMSNETIESKIKWWNPKVDDGMNNWMMKSKIKKLNQQLNHVIKNLTMKKKFNEW